MSFPLGRGPLGTPADANPYLPFHAALEAGVINDPFKLAVETATPTGVDISNGLIPNSKGAGIILRAGRVIAIDHASVEMSGHSLRIMPADKSAVAHEGRMQEEGAVILSEPDGRMKVVALIIDSLTRPWLVESLRQDHRVHGLGGLAVVHAGWFDLPDFELQDVDHQTGTMTAKQYSRLF